MGNGVDVVFFSGKRTFRDIPRKRNVRVFPILRGNMSKILDRNIFPTLTINGRTDNKGAEKEIVFRIFH